VEPQDRRLRKTSSQNAGRENFTELSVSIFLRYKKNAILHFLT
jgi:hypothetical protein